MMHQNFVPLLENLHSAFESLLDCEPHVGATRLPLSTPNQGVYLFTEGEKHLYVGRTDTLRRRHWQHWYGNHNDAPFAFKLARIQTGHYRGVSPMEGVKALTRGMLQSDPDFKKAFNEAKERVAAMEFRWIEAIDSNFQCLLEFYASISLETSFNDFKNH